MNRIDAFSCFLFGMLAGGGLVQIMHAIYQLGIENGSKKWAGTTIDRPAKGGQP